MTYKTAAPYATMQMMKTVTFYYVRHGQTVFNREGIIQGQTDSPLTESGIPVLQDTAEALRDIPFARCFSSPLQRAVSTAAIILKQRDIPVETLDDLTEMSFGRIDGKPHKEHPHALRLGHILDSFRFAGGESCNDVKRRAASAVRYMYDHCRDGDHVLISGHGSYYRYLIRAVCGKTRIGLKLDSQYTGTANGSVSVIRCSGAGAELLCYPLNARQFSEGFTADAGRG